MSGACTQIAAITANASVQKAGIDAVRKNNPFALWNNIVDAVGGKNDLEQLSTTVINNNTKLINESIIKNNCKNATATDQTNIIRQSRGCLSVIGDVCENPVTGKPDTECMKLMMEAVRINGVNQGNSDRVLSQCNINSAIQVMANQASTIDNVARLKALQDAQGAGAQNKSQQSNCNEINTNITNEQYLKAMSECINETKTKQLNMLNVCGATDINQLNDNDVMNKCLIGAGILSKTAQTAKTKNETTIDSDQTAVGLSPMASLASCGSICCCCCIIIIIIVVVGYMQQGGKNPMDTFNKFKSLSTK
jgi:hypothetical protein